MEQTVYYFKNCRIYMLIVLLCKSKQKMKIGVEIEMNQITEENLKENYKEERAALPAHFKLPAHIQFVEKEQEIEMILIKEAIETGEKSEDVQEDPASFEEGAAILNRYFQKNVKLDIDTELDLEEMNEKFEENSYLNRFLYRVLQLWEQYTWFFVSDNLDEVLFAEGGFDDWLSKREESLISDVSDECSGSKEEPLLHR